VNGFVGKVDDRRRFRAGFRDRRLRCGLVGNQHQIAGERCRRQRGDPPGGLGRTAALAEASRGLGLDPGLELAFHQGQRPISQPGGLDQHGRPRTLAQLGATRGTAFRVGFEQQTQASRAAQHLHSLGHLVPEFPAIAGRSTRRILRQKGRTDQRRSVTKGHPAHGRAKLAQ
jgi:hypothetical protein